jgi:AcrR family transcriptional regulator
MADIAEECGVAPASVYYHFRSKEGVLAAAVEAIGDEISAVSRRALEEEGLSDRERLPKVVADVFAWSARHPDEARLFYLWAAGSGPEIAALRGRFMREHIDRAIAYQPAAGRRTSPTGEVATARALAATTAIELSMAASVAWLSEDVFPPKTGPEEVAAAVATVMARILGAP